jgi:hypothetical protein
VEQPDEVRARAHHEPIVRERALERARAADLRAALEHDDPEAGAREVHGTGEAVVTAAHHDRVPPQPRELLQRRAGLVRRRVDAQT